MTEIETTRKELERLAEKEYQQFSSALIPNAGNLIGVRLPQLRKMAKDITRREWRTFIENEDTIYFEEVMLQGMVIGYARMNQKELLGYMRLFIPRIKNWSVCDSFCNGLKDTMKKNKEVVWEFIQPYLYSDREYEVRFGAVMLFHYIDEEYIDRLLHYSDTFSHEGYYARMALAWMLSTCFIKFPKRTMLFLEKTSLNTWTYNKALQKITESLRVDKETKVTIKEMKRKSLG